MNRKDSLDLGHSSEQNHQNKRNAAANHYQYQHKSAAG